MFRLPIAFSLALALLPCTGAQEPSPSEDAPDPLRQAIATLLKDRQPSPWPDSPPLPSKADLEKQLADLDTKQDADSYLPLALHYLAHFPRGEKFSYHLWRATAFAEWIERSGDPLGNKPLFPALLDLGDQLPKSDPYFFETRFLRATDLARKGDLKGQRRILLTAMEEPTFPDSFTPSFKGALAESLEKSGDTEKAIKSGASLADRMESSSKACDAVLRAALLALESGDEALGLDLLKKVSAAPFAARGKAASAEIIREFSTLVLPEPAISSHWDGAKKWWPAWKALEEKLKLPPAPLSAPLIVDIPALRQSMSQAASKEDIATYFQGYRDLARASRWLPSAVAALTDATSLASRRLRPDLGDDFRNLMVAVHENFSSDDPDLQRRHEFYFAVYLLETDQAERALKVIEDFGSRPQKNDALSQGMLQLWALCSQRSGADLAPPTSVLEDLLAGEDPVLDRPSAVKALAQLYSAQNRTADEESLLETELAKPDLKTNPEIFDSLSQRLQALTLIGGAVKKFDAALDSWKSRHLPPWFDLAEPKSLDDPRLADLEPVLRNPIATFSIAESIKLRLLVALAKSQPLERRFEAFTGAVETLLASTSTHAEYASLLRSVIDLDSLPNQIRIHFLWRGILEALNGYRKDDGLSLIAHPLAASLPEEQKDALDTFRPFLDSDPESAESLWKLYESTAKRLPLSPAQVSAILEIFSRILRLGEIDKAQAIYAASDKFTLAAGPTTKESFRLGMLRLLDIAKKTRTMNAAASDAVLAAFPPDAITRPPALDSLRGITRLRNLPESDALAIQTYLTKARLTGLATSEFWHDLIRSFGGGSHHLDLTLSLFKAMLDQPLGDLERSFTILHASELIDADDPESLNRLLLLLEPLRKDGTPPLVKDALALLDLGLALRAGKDVDIDATLAALKHPVVPDVAPRIKLLHHRLRGNTDALRLAAKDTDPDTLLKRTLLPISIPALKAAGLDAEFQLALDRARSETPRAFVDSWFAPDASSCLTALSLAETLGNPADHIPQGWLEHCLSAIQNRRSHLTLKAEHARLVGDWDSALAAASEALASYPTYYHFYWLQGIAFHKLDRQKEAAQALDIYTRYGKDEEHYPEALAILKSIAP